MLIRAGKSTASGSLSTDRIHALNLEPKDVAGAGDSLFAMASLALAVGEDIWTAGLLGSVAAACQVSRVGNKPLTIDKIKQILSTGLL